MHVCYVIREIQSVSQFYWPTLGLNFGIVQLTHSYRTCSVL